MREALPIVKLDLSGRPRRGPRGLVNWDGFWESVGQLKEPGDAVKVPDGGEKNVGSYLSVVARALGRSISTMRQKDGLYAVFVSDRSPRP